MLDLALLVAYLGLLIASFLVSRSVRWLTVWTTLVVSLASTILGFAAIHGRTLTMAGLQVVLLGCLIVVLLLSIVHRRRRSADATPWRWQFWTVLIPSALLMAFLVISRALAPAAGHFQGVGYFMLNRSAEDNAKWLDFAGQLASGLPLHQVVQLGGPLQMIIVFTATGSAAVSAVVFGGVNQVLMAVNSVIYAQFLLVALVPFALSPLAFVRPRQNEGRRVPLPAFWAAVVALATASTAAIGLGHLTLQFILLTGSLWLSTFLTSMSPRTRLATSLIFAMSATVWFPLAPVAAVILVAYLVHFVAHFVKRQKIAWTDLVLYVVVAVTLAEPIGSALRFSIALPTNSALGIPGMSTGGFFRGALVHVPVEIGLGILESQGGTEKVGPVLGLVAVTSLILAALYRARRKRGQTGWAAFSAFAPAMLLLAFALALSLAGTWLVGTGPNYGAEKTFFFVTAVILASTVPLAIMEINRARTGTNVVTWLALVALVALLTVDTIMPRALTNVTPSRWKDTYVTGGVEQRGYWWPAEVKSQGDQTITSLPIGCAYLPQNAEVPTGLPDGQLAYVCTRVLGGLNGMDSAAQPLVDWLRRDWLTNQKSWTDVWPSLRDMPADVLSKNVILLNESNQVVGLQPVSSLLDRYRPAWAVGKPLDIAQP